MTVTIEMALECAGEREAAALETVLAPDNHRVPKDQTFSFSRSANVLSFKVGSTRAASCFSSALSLLSDAKLFDELWSLAS